MDFFTSRFTTIKNIFNSQDWPTTDLRNLFSWGYWTDSTPNPISAYYLSTVLLLGVIVVGLVGWRTIMKKRQGQTEAYQWPINQTSSLAIFIIAMTATYLFFRTQSIAYLSSQLVVLLSVLIGLVWLGLIAYHFWWLSPHKAAQQLEEERFFRYIPKKKCQK